MEWANFSVEENDDGRRVDSVLRRVSSGSLSGVYAAIRKGLIRLNQQKTTARQRVTAGDTLSIASFLLNNDSSRPTETNETTETADATDSADCPVPILFENQHILAVLKPPGMLVHDGIRSLEAQLRSYLRRHTTPSLSFRPGPLHRLDRNTSGILCFSKSLPGARWFSLALQNNNIQKWYLAVAEGTLPTGYQAVWQDTLQRSNNTSRSANEGQNAETRVRCLGSATDYQSGQNYNLMGFQIITGRTHQIRAQAAHRGYPIVGDAKYGSGGRGHSMLLHAAAIHLPAWEHDTERTICAPLPRRWYKMLQLSITEPVSGLSIPAPRGTEQRCRWYELLTQTLTDTSAWQNL